MMEKFFCFIAMEAARGLPSPGREAPRPPVRWRTTAVDAWRVAIGGGGNAASKGVGF